MYLRYEASCADVRASLGTEEQVVHLLYRAISRLAGEACTPQISVVHCSGSTLIIDVCGFLAWTVKEAAGSTVLPDSSSGATGGVKLALQRECHALAGLI